MSLQTSSVKRQPSATDFKSATTNVSSRSMRHELDKLIDGVEDPTTKKQFKAEMDGFYNLFNRFLDEKARGEKIQWDKIKPPAAEQVRPYSDLPKASDPSILDKLAVLKLNGGLGTTMGCVGPKSIIEVRDGMTFLDLSVRQIEHLNSAYNVNVPFILMNSFNTHEDTKRLIQKYEDHNIQILTFNQSRYPRFGRESLLPTAETFNSPKDNWYPPGHGDIFEALFNSGLLDELINAGKEYIFVSNVDNLGAVVDLNIYQHMIDSQAEYFMEVTDKTKADVKGGTIIDYEGQARLLEVAQVPKEHVEEFKSISKFKIFNTNNLWMNLKAIKRVVENNKLSMEVIINNKALDNGTPVIQLETAVGAAIKHFKGAAGINVPRSRFLPVKSCSDLLLITSDLFSLEHGVLKRNPKRVFDTTPVIKLGDTFKKVANFQGRFKSIPNVLELDHLTVSGDVVFGKNVVLKGSVIIVANEGNRIILPDNSVIENKLVTGNLAIIDH